MLAALLQKNNISQREAARELGLSLTSLNRLCKQGVWPRRNTAAVQARTAAYMERLGVPATEAEAAVYEKNKINNPGEMEFAQKANSIPPGKNNNSEGTAMIRRQTLSQKARRAFSITRDPFSENMEAEDVWLSPGYRYVRESMYQCAAHGGFLAVIGESGSGKSTLRKDLSCRLARENATIILIEPYVIGMEENEADGKVLKATHIADAILHTLAPSLRRPRSPETRFRQVHQVLRDSRRAGNRHCLVIEEAHSLNGHTIKHLKRFYELEDGGFNRLLSVILIGQTELRNKLTENDAVVREVVQRCETVEVYPLEDVKGYVAHRCARVGLDAAKLFDDAALDMLPGLLVGDSPLRRGRTPERVSLLYPLAVGNLLTMALNAAAIGGETRVTAEVMAAL